LRNVCRNSSDKEVVCSVEHIGKCSLWDQDHLEKDGYWPWCQGYIEEQWHRIRIRNLHELEHWPWDQEQREDDEYCAGHEIRNIQTEKNGIRNILQKVNSPEIRNILKKTKTGHGIRNIHT
jgi:hypothetical protein